MWESWQYNMLILTWSKSLLTFHSHKSVGSASMLCSKCQKSFATKYTLKRHMEQFHPTDEMEDLSIDLNSDDGESNDVFNGSEADENSSNEIETENGSESEEEEPDFWNLLIRRVVAEI